MRDFGVGLLDLLHPDAHSIRLRRERSHAVIRLPQMLTDLRRRCEAEQALRVHASAVPN
jgi:hypothetical protein